jgi:beta-N-acetylhexosaminidase
MPFDVLPPRAPQPASVILGVLGGDERTTEAVLRQHPAGLVVFRHHLTDGGAAVRARLDRAGAPRPMLLVDQEGGVVRRLPLIGPLPAPHLGTLSPRATQTSFRRAGRALHRLGIAVNLAPVADVARPWSFMRSRSYGERSPHVGRHVAAAVRGLAEGSTTGCLKHFPGLGSVRSNTDHGRGVDLRSRGAVRRDLVAFRAGFRAGAPCVMVSNAITPSLCDRPAVLCASTYRLLRGLGFQGAIITDSLNAGALRAYGTPDALAVRALRAGADAAMLTGPGSTLDGIRAVDRALRSGTLQPGRIAASAARVRALRTP